MTAPDTPADVLALFPGGYPVHIDVPQASVAGSGTAMRFELPLHGHNFPLRHRHERKLVVALAGRLQLMSGLDVVAFVEAGQGVVLPPDVAHRIAQHGDAPATVGVALWPGGVEDAFRAIASQVAAQGYRREAVASLLAEYGVQWDAGMDGEHRPGGVDVRPFGVLVGQLPVGFAAALRARWERWIGAAAGR